MAMHLMQRNFTTSLLSSAMTWRSIGRATMFREWSDRRASRPQLGSTARAVVRL